ncbi:MAG TPA: TraB/GumN family protein [Candidatus Methanofastidiosa archaeon]|nr:TraB/GumN family protein [Candidatus Methanofastidiosa archaeon]
MTVKTSRVGSNEVLIVGTAHISKKSREEVKDTILENRPDIIGVELDEGRYSNIMDKDSWKNKDIYKIIREGKSHMFLANVMLSNYQKRLGEELGTTPGAEMMEAIELAGESSELALLDRDINITFKRAWKNMSLREKLKILYSIMFSFLEEGEEINEEMIEKIKEEDMLNSMLEELSGEIPNIKSTLIDERDAYIAGKIKEVLKGKDNKKMVAVVGAGHMNGIVSGLERDIDTRSLETIPPGRSYLKIVMWAVPLLFVSLLVWGFFAHGSDVTLTMLKRWFLINGTLSAIGAICALGHPISAVVSFLVAPFTSLNPTVAAGWFAGLSEAYLRKPKVKDFEELSSISSIWDLWRNKITRTLLVVAFANLGSTIGTVIAFPYLASLI